MSNPNQNRDNGQPKVGDLLKSGRTISFEFFPPRSQEGVPSVLRAIGRLSRLNPDFVSVTYGAGGSTRAFTEEIVVECKEQSDLVIMSHLTCVGQTEEEVHDVLVRMERAGVSSIMALRGDPPMGQETFVPAAGGFAHATDLIRHIRANFDFGIGGACYPEGHTESMSLEQDIEYARQKVDLGADFLVTQLFYDNAYFYEFVDKARAAGITTPIVPGLLPVLSTAQIRRITQLCGASIPPQLDRRLETYADDDDAIRQIGIEHTTNQARNLWDNGVDGIHFYVLNRTYSISRILDNLQLPGHQA